MFQLDCVPGRLDVDQQWRWSTDPVWGRPDDELGFFLKGLFDLELDGLRWDLGYPFWRLIWLCVRMFWSDVFSRLFRLFQDSTYLNRGWCGATGYPPLFLCTKMIRSGIANPNSFCWLSRDVRCFGNNIVLRFGLPIFSDSEFVPSGTCLHITDMFISLLYFALFGITWRT